MSHSFEALEGQYQYYNCSVPQYKEPQTNNIGVRLSFLENVSSYDTSPAFILDLQGETYDSQEWRTNSMYCYNIGKEIVIYLQENQNIPYDRRIFKFSPTCHAFKPITDHQKTVLLVGLINGEIQLISPIQKDTFKVFNEEKSIDKSPVTCISWVPDSPNQFLVSHSSGQMYLYDEKLPPNTTPPNYELFKEGTGFSVYTCKAKSTRNPLYRWVFGTRSTSEPNNSFSICQTDTPRANKLSPQLENGFHPKQTIGELKNELLSSSLPPANLHSMSDDTASINQFAFSPCGKYLALVTQDGYLRVLEYHTMELYGFMRSYFAGLLCVDWSPDSQFVVVGGQDDLISVWSLQYRAVICRGEGHRSWVSAVRFDPFLCPPKCNTINATDRSLPTSINGCHSTSEQNQTHSDSVITQNHQFSTVDDCGGALMLGSYRIGSVGQDTLFCLWDLTEDVIRQGVQFVLKVAPTRFPNGILDDSHSDGANFSGPPIIASMYQATESHFNSSSPSSIVKSHRVSGTIPNASASLVFSPGTTSGRSVSNLFGFLTFSRRKLTPNSSTSSTTVKTSATNYGSERIKANSLVHRFSMSSTHHRNTGDPGVSIQDRQASEDTASKCSSLNQLTDVNRLFDMNEQYLFGSPMCPKFGDVPVLAPIVTTGMHQHRLTDLIFRRNTIHVVCQQGLIRVWLRPIQIKENTTPDTRLISIADSTPSAKNEAPRSRPSGLALHPAMSSSTSARSSIPPALDSLDCGSGQYHPDPYNHGSTGDQVGDHEESVRQQQQQVYSPYQSAGVPRPSSASSRVMNNPVFPVARSNLDYEYVSGASRIHGLEHQPSTASSADV